MYTTICERRWLGREVGAVIVLPAWASRLNPNPFLIRATLLSGGTINAERERSESRSRFTITCQAVSSRLNSALVQSHTQCWASTLRTRSSASDHLRKPCLYRSRYSRASSARTSSRSPRQRQRRSWRCTTPMWVAKQRLLGHDMDGRPTSGCCEAPCRTRTGTWSARPTAHRSRAPTARPTPSSARASRA